VPSPVTADEVLHLLPSDVDVDRHTLDVLLRERPHPKNAVPLLSARDIAAIRATVAYIGVVGSMRECPLLALCLQHHDDGVAALAEHGLWTIWMQSGSPLGNQELAEAIEWLAAGDEESAVAQLERVVAREPSFAEAHFHHGVARSTLDHWVAAGQAFRQALRLNSYHFAAAANLGHTCAAQGNLLGALRYYRQALRLHPRLAELPQVVQELEERLEPGERCPRPTGT
jgi:tetratricopeptide (TPR) repeat protein